MTSLVARYTDSQETREDDTDLFQYIDRYGFVHKEPPKISIHPKEQKRTKKWLKMMSEWASNPPKLEERIRKGIPDSVRGEVWRRLLGIPKILIEQEGKYQEMLKFGLDHSRDIRQIDLDVNRTFRNHIMFRERYSTKQCMLFRLLVAYSIYNSEIGYCQGMSQVAALLLMYMNEEDSFWSLSTLMSSDRHAMHGFFIPGFPKLRRFSSHHDAIMLKLLPKVYKRFKAFGIDSTLYTLKWFFQCFLDKVPFTLTLRLWDNFIYYGEIILTGMSYTLLRLHKKTILKKNLEELINFLQSDLEQDFGYEDDDVIEALFKSIKELKSQKLDSPSDEPSPDELPSKPFGYVTTSELSNHNSPVPDEQHLEEEGEVEEEEQEQERQENTTNDREETEEMNDRDKKEETETREGEERGDEAAHLKRT